MKPQLPALIEKYVRATNSHDAASFINLFADNAVVQDINREFQGTAAIKAWSEREIFDVRVTLEIIDFANRDGETIITAKVDGTFDRTGLPDPLILVHDFAVKDDKIIRLRIALPTADETKGN
jgi:hypothetical protein